MSKVYEALQRAQTDQLLTREAPAESPSEVPPSILPLQIAKQSSKTFTLQLESEMLELDQNISNIRGHAKKSIIQFIGCQANEGTSTIVRELAKVSSTINGKTVLLIDAHDDQAQFKYFGLHPTHSLEEVIMDDQDIREAVYQVSDSQLFIAALSSRPRSTTNPEFSNKEEKVLTLARHRFDYILIDSPTIHSSIDGLGLCKHVDGVVLVIEAERTRAAIIENMTNRITQCNGKVLGIIFNKQRHYIPDWIYKWL